MKNIPNKIYLQVDPEHENPETFDEMASEEITWCRERINYNDIPYYRHKNSNQVDLLVTTTFAEKEIRKRYDIICDKIKQWDKTKRMGDYADGYRNGLVMAEKQFRHLFRDGEGHELESKSSW